MIRAEIDSRALDALIARLEAAPERFAVDADAALDEECETALAGLRAETPVDTGFLRSRWATRVTGRLRRALANATVYGPHVRLRGQRVRWVDAVVPGHVDRLETRLRSRFATIARAAIMAGPRQVRGARPRLGR